MDKEKVEEIRCVKERCLGKVQKRPFEKENSIEKRTSMQSRDVRSDEERRGQTTLIVDATECCSPS